LNEFTSKMLKLIDCSDIHICRQLKIEFEMLGTTALLILNLTKGVLCFIRLWTMAQPNYFQKNICIEIFLNVSKLSKTGWRHLWPQLTVLSIHLTLLSILSIFLLLILPIHLTLTHRIIDTSEALSGGPVAVADGVGVDVVVAVALLARPDRPVFAHRVAKVAVLTELAPRPRPAGRALDANGRVLESIRLSQFRRNLQVNRSQI
jgi:hypothetical protein